jgi:hypothetical protein
VAAAHASERLGPPPSEDDAKTAATRRGSAPATDAPRARATWKRKVEACPPRDLDARYRPVDVRLSPDLGGCMPKASRLALPELMTSPGGAPPRLTLLTDLAQLADELQCLPGRTPRVDLSQHTHALLYDLTLSSESHELVFAVDDGTTVHAGLRRTKVCQGIAPFQVVTATVLTLPAPGRNLVVHTCEPRYPTCGPVP